MSPKVKRKVTVENTKESKDQQRRPSVFDRLGPGTLSLPPQSQDRHGRVDNNEKCRNWLRTGICIYGSTCKYQHQHDSFSGPTKRSSKGPKEIDKKDLRHKVQKQREDPKESRTGSISPKRKGTKRTSSRSRKGEHESKIKSTVVVTRPCSPPAAPSESTEKEKKKPEGNWEDDSDDWPVDESQLDYKEELTLERKRQQLQRELDLELQKERMMNQNVSLSDSSSSSSSSDSGSVSSSSDSSSSSSDDSDDSSVSSSSSSSSVSQPAPKKKYKKASNKKDTMMKNTESFARKKPNEDYNKSKSHQAPKPGSNRLLAVPQPLDHSKKKGWDKKLTSPLPATTVKNRSHDANVKTVSHHVRKGPRTPSPPPPSRKQRQWGQSSSADSHSADDRKSRNKKHKKRKEESKHERHKSEHVYTPPQLSSPNRTLIQQRGQGSKKSWRKDDPTPKQYKNKDHSPALLPKLSSFNTSSERHVPGSFFSDMDKIPEKYKTKTLGRKSEESFSKKEDSRDKNFKGSRLSPTFKNRDSNSPYNDRYESEQSGRKAYPSQYSDKSDKNRRQSLSPMQRGKDNRDRKKSLPEAERRKESRDISPRGHDGRKDSHHRGNDSYKKEEMRGNKRGLSPDGKRNREDKSKDRMIKERAPEPEVWDDDHKKAFRIPDARIIGRMDTAVVQASSSKVDRSRDRDRDRKKGKDRDLLMPRSDLDRDRMRLSSPLRGASDIHSHLSLRDEPSVPVSRSHIFDSDIPPVERDYAYGYGGPHEQSYVDDRVLQPDYDSDLLRGPPLYPPPEAADYSPMVYGDSRYRRETPLKDSSHIDRIVSYGQRDVSAMDPRESVVLPVRADDYLGDLPLDERRSYGESWGRNRSIRDEWEPFSPVPLHITAGMDEDRYGMPRRRRASPDWHLRDLSVREPRSRSPQHRRLDEPPVPNRGSWHDQPERHTNRNDNQQKVQDDPKNRNGRRDRNERDRSKKNEESSTDVSVSSGNKSSRQSAKEKGSTKSSRSSTPSKKDSKKKKEDNSKDVKASSEKGSSRSKKSRENTKSESKSSSNNKSSSKAKDKPSADKHTTKSSEKSDTAAKSTSKSSTKTENDEKKKQGKGQMDDEFSDWSDDDDELLNRDINEESNTSEKSRTRSDDNRKEKAVESNDNSSKDNKERSSKTKRDGSKDSRSRISELKAESRSRPGSKERENSESSRKAEVSVPSVKESDSFEAFVIKDEAESVDYDPISDGELEALIEDPDENSLEKTENSEKKIVDALDVNWSLLMNDPKPKFIPGNARKRFKAVHVLSRIGFSKALAGPELSEKIEKFCQQQLDEEQEEDENSNSGPAEAKKKFQMEHDIAAFHVSLQERKRQRENAFSNVGPARRALCARQDLHIRKLLCRPTTKLLLPSSACVQQYGNTDAESELKKLSCPLIINATC